MITLQLGDKSYEVQDFRFAQLHLVAPIMDRIAERATSAPDGGFTVATVETGSDMLEVLAAGIDGETRDSLLEQASFKDIGAIGEAYVALMQGLGIFVPPAVEEAPAPDAIAA